jgi:acyl-CoA synthetase (AMP-forming)/AMP-acid ligase II
VDTSNDQPRFCSVYAVVEWRAATTPDAPFVKSGDRWLLGVGAGDRVAYVVPNREELIISFFASACLGATNVAMNVFPMGEFLRRQLADCQARVLIVDEAGFRAAIGLLDGTS